MIEEKALDDGLSLRGGSSLPVYQMTKVGDNVAELGLLGLDWENDIWRSADVMRIDRFLSESSNHRPLTELKLCYSELGIHGLFRAQDQYVQCVQTQFQDRVARDSCVEIYFMPRPGVVPEGQAHESYINLEISGNGTLLSYHIRDSRRQGEAFKDYDALSTEEGEKIQIETTLPARVYPEIEEKIEWGLGFFLPFAVMENTFGPLSLTGDSLTSQRWRVNAFKCTEDSSHPHWSSWAQCSEFNFHCPEEFGWLTFA